MTAPETQSPLDLDRLEAISLEGAAPAASKLNAMEWLGRWMDALSPEVVRALVSRVREAEREGDENLRLYHRARKRLDEANRILAEARSAWHDAERSGMDDHHNARGRLANLLSEADRAR